MVNLKRNKRGLLTILGVGILICAAFVLPIRTYAESSYIFPGYFSLNMEPGESREITIHYFNAEDEPMSLEYKIMRLVPMENNTFTLSNTEEYTSWVTSSTLPQVEANQEAEVSFVVSMPVEATPGTHMLAISITPQPVFAPQKDGQSSRMSISSILYINSGDITSATGLEITDFAVENKLVFELKNELMLNIENESNYALNLSGKFLVFDPRGAVLGTYSDLDSAQPLLPQNSFSSGFVWEHQSSNLLERLSLIGEQTAEVRVRLGDTDNYLAAKVKFIYIPWELLLILAGVVILIVFSFILSAIQRRKMASSNV